MFDVALAAVALAVLVPARLVAAPALARAGGDRSSAGDLAWWAGAAFLVSGRVAWLALHPEALAYPVDVIRLTQGIVTPVAVLAAVAAVVVLARRTSPAVPAAAGVVGLVAIAGWFASCALQSRCGSRLGVMPPVAWIVAIAAVGLAVMAWRSLAAARPRAVTLFGIGVALVAVASRWQPRLAGWPTWSDALLALVGAGVAVWGHRRPPHAEVTRST